MSLEAARDLLDAAHELRFEREQFSGGDANDQMAEALNILALTALANTEALLALVAKVQVEVTP
jgi:hypothetical protein